MTKKHFAALAASIALISDPAARQAAAHAVVRACAQFSPRFDRERFLAACRAG